MLAQNSAAFHQLWLNVVSKCSLFSFKCSTFGLSGENFSFLVILSGLEAIIQRVYDSTISHDDFQRWMISNHSLLFLLRKFVKFIRNLPKILFSFNLRIRVKYQPLFDKSRKLSCQVRKDSMREEHNEITSLLWISLLRVEIPLLRLAGLWNQTSFRDSGGYRFKLSKRVIVERRVSEAAFPSKALSWPQGSKVTHKKVKKQSKQKLLSKMPELLRLTTRRSKLDLEKLRWNFFGILIKKNWMAKETFWKAIKPILIDKVPSMGRWCCWGSENVFSLAR